MDSHASRARDLEAVCALAAALIAGGHLTGRSFPDHAAITLLVVGAVWPRAARWVAAPLLLLGRRLGTINAWLLLGGAYLLVVTPLALLRRAVGQAPRAFGPGSPAWVVREHRFGPDDLQNPW